MTLQNEPSLSALLQGATELSASDLALVGGSPPVAWSRGRMVRLDDGALAVGLVERMFTPLLTGVQQATMSATGDLDWGAELTELGCRADGRVRINLHRQRGDWAAAIRFIPRRIPPLESLNLPAVVGEWINLPRGLVLVTGAAGSGKSTTLAAVLQRANELHDWHVITLEDPIEYEFADGACLIEQRQVGRDSPSFAAALRHVVRQRPDVILVGEMRDRETIAAALTAAETGHLVLATLHTNSAPATIERIIDVFDRGQQAQVRVQLASTLRCILCQNLLADRRGGGQIPATEVLVATTAVRRAIRDGQDHLIDGMMETGGPAGMHSLEQDLARLLGEGRISYDDAAGLTCDVEKLRRRLAPPAAAGGRR